jgi:hypothetical protein
LIVTNGKGRLFIQTLLPKQPKVTLVSGEQLYSYGGDNYPPSRDTGPAPQCRIEISPSEQATLNHFLHVLTATDANTNSVEKATVQADDQRISVTVGTTRIAFSTAEVAGSIAISGYQAELADKIVF